MPREARKRTVAQRKQKSEDIPSDERRIQDEQEQEQEIKAMRKKNIANNERARGTLDMAIFAAMFITLMTISRHIERDNYFFAMLSGVQTALLIFSLTPSRFPVLSEPIAQYHTFLLIPHIVIFVVGIRIMTNAADQWAWPDAVRWALPEILVGAVEIQRKGERDLEARLQAWEQTMYDVKGA